ncbi:MAG: hypothetical protein OEX97_00085 [Acidimicrobiia bacterium]|nr:hypothetical protein [Acidimicrobiia bacterium]
MRAPDRSIFDFGGVEVDTVAMPSILKSRMALAALIGVFLIPILSSSLRGLTHVLTCTGQVETPFTVIIEEGSDPIVLSATQLIAGEEDAICGGIDVDFQARSVASTRIALTVVVINESSDPWRGTIDLELGRVRIPISIGLVAAGSEEAETVVLNLNEGESEIAGSLLIGP